MAGTVQYWMNVSLDLRIERKPGENGGGDWIRLSEELHREFNARAQALSLMVEGRVMYEIMESAWPAARFDPSLPEFLREFGQIWTSLPKVMVSRTRDQVQHNTKVLGTESDAIEILASVRERADGLIGVGGPTLATQLLHAGLIDELLLFVHPAILGEGRTLFDPPAVSLQLELIESKEFPLGVVMQRYAVNNEGTPAGRAA